MRFEDAVEGSLLRYQMGDLADLYRDKWTLRQLWVRVKALPPDAPLWVAYRDAIEQAETKQAAAEFDGALSSFLNINKG